MARTDKDLAQIVLGAVRLAGGDPEETKQTLHDLGLTDEELTQAYHFLESDQPILGS
ncbi:hypothetical protein ACFW96_09170 [Streptomyces gardneri]|uniref:hypothetical protein n=1 Tax=Streptomyces gardneri TaxID=66892 RepID=UPI0036BE06C7